MQSDRDSRLERFAHDVHSTVLQPNTHAIELHKKLRRHDDVMMMSYLVVELEEGGMLLDD